MVDIKNTRQKLTVILGMVLLAGAVFMGWNTVARADNLVRGFAATDELRPGLIVMLDKGAQQTVAPVPPEEPDRIYGVVVDPKNAPLTLKGKDDKAYVATSGTYGVLVSTANGSIEPGDYLSISSIGGIAAKAKPSQSTVLGQAENSFDGRSGVITTAAASAIGQVLVNISVQKNPLLANDSVLPASISRLAATIAGRSVSPLRLYVALAIFVVAALLAVTILGSGVRNSLIALGRNPLSQHSIFGGMYKVIFTGISIFILGLAGVYLLLKI